jgi:hypothetical protein
VGGENANYAHPSLAVRGRDPQGDSPRLVGPGNRTDFTLQPVQAPLGRGFSAGVPDGEAIIFGDYLLRTA